MSYEQYMRTLRPNSMKIWWFNRALSSLIHLSVLRDLFLKPWADQHVLTFKVNVKVKLDLLTVACNCSILVVFLFSVLSFLFFFFRISDCPRESPKPQHLQSHNFTHMWTLTSCRAPDIFWANPDYHSGSRAKSVFSDSHHYLHNLSSVLQLQDL